MDEKLLTIQEVANLLGVSTKTLRRWDQRGRLVPTRTAGNQRRYTQEQINSFRQSKSLRSEDQASVASSGPQEPSYDLPSALQGLQSHMPAAETPASAGEAPRREAPRRPPFGSEPQGRRLAKLSEAEEEISGLQGGKK